MRIRRITVWLATASAGLVAGEDMITFVKSDFVGNITDQPSAAVFIVDGKHGKTFTWTAINDTVVEGVKICTVKENRECGTVAYGTPTPTASSSTGLSLSASMSTTPTPDGAKANMQSTPDLTPVVPSSAVNTSPPSADASSPGASTDSSFWPSSWDRRRGLTSRRDSDDSGDDDTGSDDNDVPKLTVESTATEGRVIISPEVFRQLMENHARVAMYVEALWSNEQGRSYSRRFALVPANEDMSGYAENNNFNNISNTYPEVNPNTAHLSASVGSSSAPAPSDNQASDNGLPTGAIVGIAIACGVVLMGLATAVLWMLCHRRKSTKVALAYGEGDGDRTQELIVEKEAGGGIPPHSPYSDVTPESSVRTAHRHRQQHAQHVRLASQDTGGGGGPVRGVTDDYGPLSPPSVGSPSVFGASIRDRRSPGRKASLTRPGAAAQEWPLGMTSHAAASSTSSGVTGQYAHLVEEGMTEEEIRRLEEEERQLDAAIAEQAAAGRS